MIRHFPVLVAAAVAFTVLPPATGCTPFADTAQAQGAGGGGGPGGGGGGPGGAGGSAGAGAAGGGIGTAGAHGVGNATAEAATDPSTTGLGKAQAVVGTTPAAEESEALGALEQAAENQGTTGQTSSMSFGQAVENMAESAQSALGAIFGGGSEPSSQ